MKYCNNCGKELDDDVKFCPFCGAEQPCGDEWQPPRDAQADQAAPQQDAQMNGAQQENTVPQQGAEQVQGKSAQERYQEAQQPFQAAPQEGQQYQQPYQGQTNQQYQQQYQGQANQQYQSHVPQGQYQAQNEVYDSGSFGWAVLGFFIPLVGLILFLVWRKTKPKSAKNAGIGALVGFCLNLLTYFIYMA